MVTGHGHINIHGGRAVSGGGGPMPPANDYYITPYLVGPEGSNYPYIGGVGLQQALDDIETAAETSFSKNYLLVIAAGDYSQGYPFSYGHLLHPDTRGNSLTIAGSGFNTVINGGFDIISPQNIYISSLRVVNVFDISVNETVGHCYIDNVYASSCIANISEFSIVSIENSVFWGSGINIHRYTAVSGTSERSTVVRNCEFDCSIFALQVPVVNIYQGYSSSSTHFVSIVGNSLRAGDFYLIDANSCFLSISANFNYELCRYEIFGNSFMQQSSTNINNWIRFMRLISSSGNMNWAFTGQILMANNTCMISITGSTSPWNCDWSWIEIISSPNNLAPCNNIVFQITGNAIGPISGNYMPTQRFALIASEDSATIIGGFAPECNYGQNLMATTGPTVVSANDPNMIIGQMSVL